MPSLDDDHARDQFAAELLPRRCGVGARVFDDEAEVVCLVGG
jgi:hypothetical protein